MATMSTSAISPHRLDRIAALRAESEAVLTLIRTLSDEEWHTPSAADGWRVQEVVAHMAAACHGSFTPWLLSVIRSNAVERGNDDDAEARRGWEPSRVLAEYERWSPRFVRLQAISARTPGSGLAKIRLGELGTYPLTLFASAFVFDHWTHLAHDIAPVLDRPPPTTDANRTAVVTEWILAGLEQMSRHTMGWLDRPVGLTLDGPGGGTWSITPAGGGTLRVRPVEPDGDARIAGTVGQLPVWSTGRRPWRECDLTITGNTELGERWLDSIVVV